MKAVYMTSNLTLAQKLQAKSAEQAKILEEAQSSALKQLKESLSESLNENLTTMKTATGSLCEQAEGLSESLTDHLSNMNTATAEALKSYRETTHQALLAEQKQMRDILNDHRIAMATATQEHNNSIMTIIRTQARPYIVSAMIVVVIMLFTGILFGLFIAKIF